MVDPGVEKRWRLDVDWQPGNHCSRRTESRALVLHLVLLLGLVGCVLDAWVVTDDATHWHTICISPDAFSAQIDATIGHRHPSCVTQLETNCPLPARESPVNILRTCYVKNVQLLHHLPREQLCNLRLDFRLKG